MTNDSLQPRVLLVILNWNGRADSEELLRSLTKLRYSNATTLVIDNGSKINEAEVLQSIFPSILTHRNAQNLGYAGGNNTALSYVHEYDYVAILNNDLTVDSDFLSPLVKVLESDPVAGIACSVVRDYKHRERIQSAGGFVNRITGWVSLYHKIPRNPYVTFAPGACFLIRANQFSRLGGFDTDFFAYWEDSDLSIRLRKSGFQCRVVNSSVVFHKTSASSKYLSRLYVYYMLRNQLFFMRKHCPLIYRPLFLIFFFLRNVPAYIFLTFWQKSSAGLVIPKAIIDGFWLPLRSGVRQP